MTELWGMTVMECTIRNNKYTKDREAWKDLHEIMQSEVIGAKKQYKQ